MTKHRFAFAAVLGGTLLLAGCAGAASGPGAAGGDPGEPVGIGATIAAPGEVVGQGTVLQTGDAAPQFCLGPVAESYPPQCSGPELVGWDWDAVDGDETSGETTFGAYAIWGGWNGERLTVTSSIMLALYDPMPFVDPLLDEANAGDADPADLERIQTEITESAPFVVLSSAILNGYLFVDVIYDDGSMQAWADARYLPDTVAIRPALRDVDA
jgi:hypothetical protein